MKFRATGTISCEDIEYAYKKYPNEEIIIVMSNTKEQDADNMIEIARRYPQVKFSVTGGLDQSKEKFNNEHYQQRTYYSAMELSKIISIYRGIEKQIDLDWTETQKAMFIYKQLCERMQYGECIVDGRDYSLGIGGLLYNTAVCSGFSMIYKEALDRMGIECHYQNRKGHHSWNIAKLDGKYRALELTWDTCNKGENGCGFHYFNRCGTPFYSDKHHDITYEKEETKFPITQYTDEEIFKAYNVIAQQRILEIPLGIYQSGVAETGVLPVNGIQCVICKGSDGSISLRTVNPNEYLSNKGFVRDDGTHFMLISRETTELELKKFLIVEGTQTGIKIGKIYSEQDLISMPTEYSSSISNGLLGTKRLEKKINHFNGYVGFLGNNHSRCYNRNIEKNRLNVIR